MGDVTVDAVGVLTAAGQLDEAAQDLAQHRLSARHLGAPLLEAAVGEFLHVAGWMVTIGSWL